MNKDRKKKNRNDYLFVRVLLTQKLIHVFFLYQIILIIRLVIVVRFFIEIVTAIAGVHAPGDQLMHGCGGPSGLSLDDLWAVLFDSWQCQQLVVMLYVP